MFDQLKIIKEYFVEIKGRYKLFFPQFIVNLDSPYHDEHSAVVVKIKLGAELILNLEPTTYLNSIRNQQIGLDFLAFIKNETNKSAISSSVNENFGFFIVIIYNYFLTFHFLPDNTLFSYIFEHFSHIFQHFFFFFTI
jgi:hypothetical protein